MTVRSFIQKDGPEAMRKRGDGAEPAGLILSIAEGRTALQAPQPIQWGREPKIESRKDVRFSGWNTVCYVEGNGFGPSRHGGWFRPFVACDGVLGAVTGLGRWGRD